MKRIAFRETCKTLYELMQIEMNRTRRTISTVSDTVNRNNSERLKNSVRFNNQPQLSRTDEEACYPHPDRQLVTPDAERDSHFCAWSCADVFCLNEAYFSQGEFLKMEGSKDLRVKGVSAS